MLKSSINFQSRIVSSGKGKKKLYIQQTAQNYSVIYFQTTLASRSQTIAGEAILVTGIQREIESKSDLPTTWHSHFDQYG